MRQLLAVAIVFGLVSGIMFGLNQIALGEGAGGLWAEATASADSMADAWGRNAETSEDYMRIWSWLDRQPAMLAILLVALLAAAFYGISPGRARKGAKADREETDQTLSSQ